MVEFGKELTVNFFDPGFNVPIFLFNLSQKFLRTLYWLSSFDIGLWRERELDRRSLLIFLVKIIDVKISKVRPGSLLPLLLSFVASLESWHFLIFDIMCYCSLRADVVDGDLTIGYFCFFFFVTYEASNPVELTHVFFLFRL